MCIELRRVPTGGVTAALDGVTDFVPLLQLYPASQPISAAVCPRQQAARPQRLTCSTAARMRRHAAAAPPPCSWAGQSSRRRCSTAPRASVMTTAAALLEGNPLAPCAELGGWEKWALDGRKVPCCAAESAAADSNGA